MKRWVLLLLIALPFMLRQSACKFPLIFLEDSDLFRPGLDFPERTFLLAGGPTRPEKPRKS